MGGACCSNEEQRDEGFTFGTHDKKKLMSNMGAMQEDPDIAKNAPKSSIANQVPKMNEMSEVVNRVYNEEGPPQGDRSKFNNEFKDCVILGPFKFTDGATYEGQFKDGQRHGFGRQIWQDGSVYEGIWRQDKCNGTGRLINAEGHIYFGDWRDDKAEGQGTFKHTDGTKYVGEWKNDVQNGRGIETWADGSVYEGMYKDSLKHGHGLFKWADGSKYEGEFKNNDICGKGNLNFIVRNLYLA
jgi:hypothetical protein